LYNKRDFFLDEGSSYCSALEFGVLCERSASVRIGFEVNNKYRYVSYMRVCVVFWSLL